MTSLGSMARPFATAHGTALAVLMSVGLAPGPAGAQQWTRLGTSGGRTE
jgi:hypothetical protein